MRKTVRDRIGGFLYDHSRENRLEGKCIAGENRVYLCSAVSVAIALLCITTKIVCTPSQQLPMKRGSTIDLYEQESVVVSVVFVTLSSRED